MSTLISFEGIDGSGKSTLIEKVSERLGNSIITREPRGTNLGYKIWEILNESIEKNDIVKGKRTNLFLFLASHSEHSDSVIKPALQEGKNVLIDRYIDSTFVYQCLNKNLEVKKVYDMINDIIQSPIPKITFILDIDPAIAKKRIEKRIQESGEYTNFDLMEINFHKKVRSFFQKLKEIFPKRIFLINADQKPQHVFNDVLKILEESKVL